MASVRSSKQRDAIKAYLMATKSHPTAEMVYDSIRHDFPNISLGTVYRNLNFLVERGEALRLDCGDGVVHFDGTTSQHNHFYCRKCKRIFDLKMDNVDHINIIANAGFEGQVEEHILYFRGLCKDCLEKKDV
ncbi:MAG: transcriptional repressor [Clostridiaceae bacterium]|nr:transcriptional repressor [Clostridiaceae bacterium]